MLALVGGGALAQAALYPLLAAAARLVVPRPALASWLTLAAVGLAHLLCVKVVEKRPWADVRLGRLALRPGGLATGAALGVAAVAIPTGALALAGALRFQPGAPGSSLGAAATLLGALAPAALMEELLVRGYPFLVLRESVGALPALLLTSTVFGVLHLQNPGATLLSTAVVTLAGVFLGGVLLATGSLWAAFAAHLAWNWTLAGVFHAAVSGLGFAAPDYRLVDAGPDWLTGGAWGPEGGAAAAAGLLGALALLQFRTARARNAAHQAHALTASSLTNP